MKDKYLVICFIIVFMLVWWYKPNNNSGYKLGGDKEINDKLDQQLLYNLKNELGIDFSANVPEYNPSANKLLNQSELDSIIEMESEQSYYELPSENNEINHKLAHKNTAANVNGGNKSSLNSPIEKKSEDVHNKYLRPCALNRQITNKIKKSYYVNVPDEYELAQFAITQKETPIRV